MVHDEKDFGAWLDQFKPVIASFDYYVDFDKVYVNAEKWKAELHLMNSLLGSENIERDFLALVRKYPDCLQTVPILIAVRSQEIPVLDVGGLVYYQFGKRKRSTEAEYLDFMRSTGLFELMEEHRISNLYDYVFGVEVGLDSNGRKNRGGHLMENHVEMHLQAAGLKRRFTDRKTSIDGDPTETGVFYKELNSSQIQEFWGIDLSPVTNDGTVEKRFDFVAHGADGAVYGIETNFYAAGGSKLNETARSYKEMAQESAGVEGFEFVWVTDGRGWISARNNLRETFEVMEHIYNLTELEEGAFKRLFA